MSRLHTMSEGLARMGGPHYCTSCGADWPCHGSLMENADARRVAEASDVALRRERIAGARDALIAVGMLNGNGHDEPADPALDAAEDAIRRVIHTLEHPHD